MLVLSIIWIYHFFVILPKSSTTKMLSKNNIVYITAAKLGGRGGGQGEKPPGTGAKEHQIERGLAEYT